MKTAGFYLEAPTHPRDECNFPRHGADPETMYEGVPADYNLRMQLSGSYASEVRLCARHAEDLLYELEAKLDA